MLEKLKNWIATMEQHPKWGRLAQFIRFGIVGVSNTAISLAVYYLCYNWLGMHYQLANVLSFVVSVTNAYYWNARFVFKTGVSYTFTQHLKAYCKAFLSYGSTFLLSTALLTFWVEVCHMSENLAPLVNLLITIPLNFVLNKYWAFREKK